MKKTPIVAFALIAFTALAACGDDEDDASADNGTINVAAAQQTASLAFASTQTAVGGDGQAAAFSMVGVGTSALGLVTPGSGSQAMGAGSQGLGSVSLPQAGAGCECTANSCNFDGCDTGAGLQLSGTISWTDNSLDCDYSVSGNQGGATYAFNIFCDLDYTDTSLDGQLTTSGSIDIDSGGANGSSSWETDMSFNMVTYANGQPSGGSIDMSASITAGGSTYSADETITF